jgi:hypothetical protein
MAGHGVDSDNELKHLYKFQSVKLLKRFSCSKFYFVVNPHLIMYSLVGYVGT